jgi:hypothetical protein
MATQLLNFGVHQPRNQCFRLTRKQRGDRGSRKKLHVVVSAQPLTAIKVTCTAAASCMEIVRMSGRLRTGSAGTSPLTQEHYMSQCGAEKAGKAALIAVVLSTGISMAPPDLQLLQPARADDDVRALGHYSQALDVGTLTSLCSLTSSFSHAHRLACQLHRSTLLQMTAGKPSSPEREHLPNIMTTVVLQCVEYCPGMTDALLGWQARERIEQR